jgi:hypothetical protein
MEAVHALTMVLSRQVLCSSPYTVLQTGNISILVPNIHTIPYFDRKKILEGFKTIVRVLEDQKFKWSEAFSVIFGQVTRESGGVCNHDFSQKRTYQCNIS